MAETLIEGEPLELIRQAFRGMKARRGTDGWVSLTGRLDPVPGEALLRALHRAEARLPRRIRSTREEHRAEALDEIARQFTSIIDGDDAQPPSSTESGRAVDDHPVVTTPATEEQIEPTLRAHTEMTVAAPIDTRLRQIEAEANFIASIVRCED